MKTQRQARILELIARYDVKTQDEITAMLREEGFNTKLSLEAFLLGSFHGSNFPNFDTITRVRRKIQEMNPDLRPPKGDQIRREDAEQEYLDYARE